MGMLSDHKGHLEQLGTTVSASLWKSLLFLSSNTCTHTLTPTQKYRDIHTQHPPTHIHKDKTDFFSFLKKAVSHSEGSRHWKDQMRRPLTLKSHDLWVGASSFWARQKMPGPQAIREEAAIRTFTTKASNQPCLVKAGEVTLQWSLWLSALPGEGWGGHSAVISEASKQQVLTSLIPAITAHGFHYLSGEN